MKVHTTYTARCLGHPHQGCGVTHRFTITSPDTGLTDAQLDVAERSKAHAILRERGWTVDYGRGEGEPTLRCPGCRL
jgi:hypothetical protein